MLTLTVLACPLVLAAALIDRAICRSYDRQLGELLEAHGRRGRAQIARFEARWGRI